MKKFIALCLAIVMCVSLFSACNTKRPEETTASKPEQTTEEKVTPTESESKPTETESESKPTETESGTQTPPALEYDVEAAAEYLDSMYKKASTVTAADYEVVAQLLIASVKYTVTWTTNTDKVTVVAGSPYCTIQVDEKSAEEVNYVITATITAPDGTTATVSYERKVPQYNVTSFEDYMAAEQDDIVTVVGIVVALNSKSLGNTRNHIFMADLDGKGGYYCYQLDKDPVEAGVKVGMTVSVTAPVSPYSGMQETKGGDFVIVDETIKTVEPTNITEAFASGASLKNYVGLVVTINGVTLGNQELGGTSDYLKFSLNGKESYVRSYITDFPTTLTIVKGDNSTTSPDKDAMDADHAAHFGYTADVTGVLVLYSGNPYLIPISVTPFTNYTFVEKTAEEKVDAELDNLTIDASVSADKVIDLIATGKNYNDVTLTWATDDATGAATIADGKLTLVVPDATVTVKVTVTATCGDVTKTKEFSIKLSKTITTITEAIAIGSAKEHNTYTTEKYIIAGIIKEVYNAQYGNMYIVDELGNTFTVYGAYDVDGTNRYDAMENKPVAGDYVVILGSLGQYNGTPQMKNGWIQSYTTSTSITDANTIGAAQDSYTDEKYVVTGTVTEIKNTQYGNVYIEDAEGNRFYIYGLYSSNGAVRFDGMTTAPAIGDTITVLGILGQYKGTAQMKNGWLIAHTAGAEEGTEETTEGTTEDTTEDTTEGTTEPEVPAADSLITIEQALVLGAAKDHNVFEGDKYYVVGTVQEVYNTQYGNMRIVDEAGNILTIYGSYSADGSTRYDAMENKPVAGDTVKIYGVVGRYNDTIQIKNGWIVEHTAAVEDETCDHRSASTDHDADYNAVCSVCGETYKKYVDTLWDKYLFAGDMMYINATPELTDDGAKFVGAVTGMGDNLGAGNIILILEDHPGVPNSEYFFVKYKVGEGTTLEIAEQSTGGDWYWMSDVSTIVEDGEWHVLVYQCTTDKASTFKIYFNAPEGVTPTIEIAYAGFAHTADQIDQFLDAKGDKELVALPDDGEEANGNKFEVVIADYADANGWTNSTPYNSFNISEDITVTATGTPVGNYGLNTGKYYENGENWRIYQNENPEVTITVAEGKTIVSVKITYATKNDGVLTLNGEQIASETVVEVNASSITFSVGNTGEKTNGQAQITAIEVVCA